MLVQTGDVLGEAPLWCPEEQALYWGDLLKPAIHRFCPGTGELTSWQPPVKFGSFSLRAGGGLIMATREGVAFYDPERGTLEPVCNPEADRPGNIPNDGKCDRQGRFWFGSMDKMLGAETGAVYRIDPDGGHRRMVERVGLSNGLAISPDDRTFYFTDTQAKCIYGYEFDPGSGELGDRRVVVDGRDAGGDLDGMTVDVEGHLWSTIFDGAKLVRYTPEGQVEREIALPVTRPTSCIFGGPALDVLYVTTATFRLSEADRAGQPLAGSVLAVHVGVAGLPETRFAG
jgi:sugar lactone lactonase YvrE